MTKATKRGRPKLISEEIYPAERQRVKYVIEETSGIYDIYAGKKPIPLPSGKVAYSEGFVDIWDKLVKKSSNE